eukprot:SAG31_NODE_13650_length_855_cov_1.419312_1_plen_212_part_01
MCSAVSAVSAAMRLRLQQLWQHISSEQHRDQKPVASASNGRHATTADTYTFSAPLTAASEASMVAAYNGLGFVVVSGLIPRGVVLGAEAAMWEAIERHPENKRQHVSRAAGSWPAKVVSPQLHALEITALWGEEYLRVAKLLSDEYHIEEGAPGRDCAPLVAPQSVMSINTFPAPQPPAAWQAPAPHLDHCIPADGYEAFPRPVRISTMTYL